jgi:hypothetical protein
MGPLVQRLGLARLRAFYRPRACARCRVRRGNSFMLRARLLRNSKISWIRPIIARVDQCRLPTVSFGLRRVFHDRMLPAEPLAIASAVLSIYLFATLACCGARSRRSDNMIIP